jgi:hypothetical protein
MFGYEDANFTWTTLKPSFKSEFATETTDKLIVEGWAASP